MVVHTVLMKIREEAHAAERNALALAIAELGAVVCGPGNYAVGRNSTEEPLNGGFDFGFVMWFADHGALDAYHVNPAHLAVRLAIRDLAESIVVFDLDQRR